MSELFRLLLPSLLETIVMVSASTALAALLGFPLGVLLYMLAPQGLLQRPRLRILLERVVNVLRSFPFIILMIVLFPVTRFIVGTSIGTMAAIVPLAIAAAPFVARVVESALEGIDRGIVEAAITSGASKARIVFSVLVPEAAPALISGLTLTIINLVGYSAMAGAIGGGGLGDLAIRYGYQRFRTDIMTASVLVIIVLVEGIQFIGTRIARDMLRRR